MFCTTKHLWRKILVTHGVWLVFYLMSLDITVQVEVYSFPYAVVTVWVNI